MGYHTDHSRMGFQYVRIALLPAAPRACKPGMLARMAIGTRRPRPHAAHEPKRAAQTACTLAMQARDLESTGGGSAGDARHLVDHHRWPRQMSADKSIDGLRASGTGSEGQHRAAACLRSSQSQVHAAHTGFRFEESGSGL